ncbi:nudix hydrolase domain-containing protein, partial [Haematococcus lacustris]
SPSFPDYPEKAAAPITRARAARRPSHRYLTVLDRKVKITESNGEAKELHFDVVGHPRWHFSFACVFPFHTAKGDQPAEVGAGRGQQWVEGHGGPELSNCALCNGCCCQGRGTSAQAACRAR